MCDQFENKGRTCKGKSFNCDETAQLVRAAILCSPWISTCRCSCEMKLSQSTKVAYLLESSADEALQTVLIYALKTSDKYMQYDFCCDFN